MTRTRVINACLTAAGVGMLAAVVRALMRPSTPLPRWDLLACLALTAVGLVSALRCLRRGAIPQAGQTETCRYWWPDRNDGWVVAGLWATIIPVGMFFYAALSFSPEAARIVEAKGSIQEVSVQKVLSSEYVREKHSGHYEVVARVAVSFDSGARSEKVQFTSESQVESGSKVWAFYAPSSAKLGVLVNGDREVLEEKTGGFAQWGIVAIVLFMTGFCLLWGAFFGGFTKASRGLRSPLKKGLCRSLPVTVKSVGVVMDSTTNTKGVTTALPKPRVRLEGHEWELLLDPAIDPSHLSREIKGLEAKLYWVKFAANRPGAKRVRAMLVLDGQRCVQGVLRVAGGSECPEGDPVPAAESLPEGDGLRAIRTYPVWDPKVHAEGLWWLVAAVVALAAVVFGVGRWGAGILCFAAFGCLFIARMVMKDRRTRYLKGFLPDPEPETGR
ncbi:hypothetical protein WKI65_12150 [Streptomyces sp. MS1.AVA.3]|uniref:hypothetical protein n=1 Tax=Streptomyces decoyicus TaxID=249567 RepID=UPI0030C4BDD4